MWNEIKIRICRKSVIILLHYLRHNTEQRQGWCRWNAASLVHGLSKSSTDTLRLSRKFALFIDASLEETTLSGRIWRDLDGAGGKKVTSSISCEALKRVTARVESAPPCLLQFVVFVGFPPLPLAFPPPLSFSPKELHFYLDFFEGATINGLYFSLFYFHDLEVVLLR